MKHLEYELKRKDSGLDEIILLDLRRKKTSEMNYLSQYMRIRAHFELENEVSSDMSYFWYSDIVQKNVCCCMSLLLASLA